MHQNTVNEISSNGADKIIEIMLFLGKTETPTLSKVETSGRVDCAPLVEASADSDTLVELEAVRVEP